MRRDGYLKSVWINIQAYANSQIKHYTMNQSLLIPATDSPIVTRQSDKDLSTRSYAPLKATKSSSQENMHDATHKSSILLVLALPLGGRCRSGSGLAWPCSSPCSWDLFLRALQKFADIDLESGSGSIVAEVTF